MRWLDWLLRLPGWRAYVEAIYLAARYPDGQTSAWCQTPTRCRRPHRIVFVKPPGKPLRAGLKHLRGD